MKIGLQTWGTDGDILPFIALAKGLKEAGHEVTLAYTSVDGKTYEAACINLLKANGSVGFNPPKNPYSMGKRPGSFGEYSALIKDYFDPFTASMYEASEVLCKSCDLVVGHSICYTLAVASEVRGTPRVAVALVPQIVRTVSVAPTGGNYGRMINSLMWWIGDAVSTKVWFQEGQKLRENLGLKPVKSLQKQVFTSDLLTLVACSPSLVIPPTDWAENVVMTGFLPTGSAIESELTPEIRAFLDAGEPPVYMTFGSCMQFEAEKFTELLVNAAVLSGRRAIIQTNVKHAEFGRNEKLFRVERAPHSLVFPKCELVVHHGGAGTTQAVLRAGKPSVVVWHGFDQRYWAEQLFRIGLSRHPLCIRGISAKKLTENIISTLEGKGIPPLSESLRGVTVGGNGVSEAISAITHNIF